MLIVEIIFVSSLLLLAVCVGGELSIEERRAKRLEEIKKYKTCSYGNHKGHFTRVEMDLREAVEQASIPAGACEARKKPNPTERFKYWNYLRTGEMTVADVTKNMNADCKGEKVDLGPWSERMPNRVYAWSVDFHPAPGVCNMHVYHDIGVTLHLECDAKPYCERAGVCRDRMNEVFGLGYSAIGYALDPDPPTTIKKFYQVYKDDEEMKRVDVFICSHPAANCELFEPFLNDSDTKSLIMYPTTRLEFGRNDPLLHWREKEIKTMGSWFELRSRWKRTVDFIHRYSSAKRTGKRRLWLVANNMYDVAYTEYFTGIRPVYIPSWCGDLDNSYGHSKDFTGCTLNSLPGGDPAEIYKPENDMAVFVTHFNKQWARGEVGYEDANHPLFQELTKATKNFTDTWHRKPCSVAHSHDVMQNHKPEEYKKYKAVIWLPYQVSVMSFFEMYRQNIPMFAPSLKAMKHWHWVVDMLSNRIYGNPERFTDEIKEYVKENGGMMPDDNIITPNYQHHERNMDYWFGYMDIYVFENIILFDNFDHLLYLLDTVDLAAVAGRMAEYNERQRESIMLKWHDIFNEAAPHRDRKSFVDEYGIDEERVRKWTKQQDKKIEMRITQYQGDVNPCIMYHNCTGALGTVHHRDIDDPRVYDNDRRRNHRLRKRKLSDAAAFIAPDHYYNHNVAKEFVQ